MLPKTSFAVMTQTSALIYIVEDETEISELLEENLRALGFRTHAVQDSAGLFEALDRKAPDLILLDIMLPGEDGLAICRRLRLPGSQCENTPLIFLSALGELADRVVGLELGADDYLTKPFEMRELVARIRALLRRAKRVPQSAADQADVGADDEHGSIWRFGPWRINMASHTLIDENDVTVALSAKEFKLLNLFLRNPHRVLSRDAILDRMSAGLDNYDRSIDVQISRLRAKLRDSGRNATLIRTMRGDGYMLAVAVEKPPASERKA